MHLRLKLLVPFVSLQQNARSWILPKDVYLAHNSGGKETQTAWYWGLSRHSLSVSQAANSITWLEYVWKKLARVSLES